MVAEPAFAEAVEAARANPRLGVGLHVVTTYDRALLPSAQIDRLVDSTGRFRRDPLAAGLTYAFSSKARAQLQIEIAAQFARFAETGLPWSHVDGHQHFHMHPFVWDTVLDQCDRYGIHRIRVPHEEFRAHFRAQGDGPNLNSAATLALRAMRRRNLRVLNQRGTLGGRAPFLCDRVYGQLQTGNMHTAYVKDLLGRLPAGLSEVYLHPGADHARALPPEERKDGIEDVELLALLDSGVRHAVEENGLITGSYPDTERRIEVIREAGKRSGTK
jgi:hopanoid biosynthesis associated protein HpnK